MQQGTIGVVFLSLKHRYSIVFIKRPLKYISLRLYLAVANNVFGIVFAIDFVS